MRARRLVAALIVCGSAFLAGCDDELLAFDSYGYSTDWLYSLWPDDSTGFDTDDGGYWSDDILDRKSG